MEYFNIRAPKKRPKKRVRVINTNPLTGRDKVSYVEIDSPRQNDTLVSPQLNSQSHREDKEQSEPTILSTETSHYDPISKEWKTEFSFCTMRIPKKSSEQHSVPNHPGGEDLEPQPGTSCPHFVQHEEFHTPNTTHQTGIFIFNFF